MTSLVFFVFSQTKTETYLKQTTVWRFDEQIRQPSSSLGVGAWSRELAPLQTCQPDRIEQSVARPSLTLLLRINGLTLRIDADPMTRLSRILRDELGLTGLKEGCCEGECGACTVLVDGLPVNACLVLGFQAQDRNITTVEGLREAGKLAGLQEAFLTYGAVQCGYCSPGMVMAAEGFLRANTDPSAGEIRHALAGNLCRCTGFETIVQAVASEAARRERVRT
ncbi:(2Fe-2S)-binding protein [Mesorhizobium composti]|jgi:aerobic-type carbon monoxide dehydrogenase small subunit (CoxS/CutS family)|uniref:(2Fe-2S)-binding protein n=1 Tax=Ollibium composti TaxID=2675109 RepID=A0ABY2Q3B7_9HYPH|nr:(2Fe-2S)-binding protein [Mesorhizobium composti]